MPEITKIYTEKGRTYQVNNIYYKHTFGMEAAIGPHEQDQLTEIRVKLSNTVDVELERQIRENLLELGVEVPD